MQQEQTTVAAVSVELTQFDEALAQVAVWAAEQYAGPVNDVETLNAAKKARLFWVTKRTDTEKQKKEIKRQIKAVADAVEERAGKYTEALLVHELAVKEKITAYEELKEKEKAEKAAEAQRALDLINSQIQDFKAEILSKINSQTDPAGVDAVIGSIQPGTPANFGLLAGEYAMALLAIKEAGAAQKMRLQIAALEAEKLERENEERKRREEEGRFASMRAAAYQKIKHAGTKKQLEAAWDFVKEQNPTPAYAIAWDVEKTNLSALYQSIFFQLQSEAREAEMAAQIERMARENEEKERAAKEQERIAKGLIAKVRRGQLKDAGFALDGGAWKYGTVSIDDAEILQATEEKWAAIVISLGEKVHEYDTQAKAAADKISARIAEIEALGYSQGPDAFWHYYTAPKVGLLTIQNADDTQWADRMNLYRQEVANYNEQQKQNASGRVNDRARLLDAISKLSFCKIEGIDTAWGEGVAAELLEGFARFKTWAEKKIKQ